MWRQEGPIRPERPANVVAPLGDGPIVDVAAPLWAGMPQGRSKLDEVWGRIQAMTTLAQYIDDQGILHQVDASYTVRDAVRYMTDRGTGAVGVLVFGELVGVLTERDVLKRVVAPEMDLDTTLVYEVMTPVVVTAELTDSVAEAVECMRERGCRHVMVQHPRRRADFVGFLGRDELLLAEHRRQSNVLPFGSPREIVDDGSVPIDLAA